MDGAATGQGAGELRISAPVTDGRRARGDRTKDALANAAIELIEAGNPTPSSRQVAVRAGYAVRTVFYHFAGVEDLLHRAVELQMARYGPLVAFVPPSGPTLFRVQVTCHQRREFFEAIGPVLRVARARASLAGKVDDLLDQQRVRLRRQLTMTLRPEILARGTFAQVTLEALEVATGWPNWSALRFDSGHSADAAEKIVVYTVSHMLEG
jgi:TetR/AcrR family transcriptional regulator of autoinduction and epiphytic fitness